jgi:hypothetical protein
MLFNNWFAKGPEEAIEEPIQEAIRIFWQLILPYTAEHVVGVPFQLLSSGALIFRICLSPFGSGETHPHLLNVKKYRRERCLW